MSQMTIEFGVGKELRAARLKAELKTSDVAEELNLRVEHIVAIEKDNYADLPGTTYVIGFVKSYAKLLGLNDVHLIDRLMQSGFIPSLAPATPALEDDVAEPVDKSVLGVAFLVLLLVSILAGVYFYFSSGAVTNIDTAVEMVEEPAAEVVAKAKPVTKTKVSVKQELIPMLVAEKKAAVAKAKPVKSKIIGTKPKGARVMLTAIEDAWFQVYNPKTKKKYLNAVLKSGHSVWLENDAEALIDIGRPHKVAITVDGKSYGVAGPSWGGVVKKLSADPDFLVYDYFGKGLNKKSYNRWLKKQR